MKKAYLILAQGFELIEAMTPLDVLKRAGVEVTTVSIGDGVNVCSSQGVEVKADTVFESGSFRDGDLLILPGGYPGYENIGNHKDVIELAAYYLNSNNKYLGAICGAPSALAKARLIDGRRVTAHFTVKDLLIDSHYVDEKVVIDGNLITSTGAGRSLDFALVLGEVLTDHQTMEKVKKGMTLI